MTEDRAAAGLRSVLVEVRVLDGPNLYFPRPAVKLTLALPEVGALAPEPAAALGGALGLRGVQPGPAGSAQRQRFAVRLAVHVTRRVAAAAGTSRLAVRGRPGTVPEQVVVAYPWRHRDRARALGEAVGAVLAGREGLERAADGVRAAEPGPGPDVLDPRIPVVSVTGTNGKTTVTRLLGHLSRSAGLRTGWTSTDGIYIDGGLVEAGDWSGPGGARRVLAERDVELAVLETARGGLLLRGMGVACNDVAVVTNVSADHLGLLGIDTVDQLAEVKSTIVRVTRPTGWVVLNGDDPRVLAMRLRSKARPWVFSLDPDSPSLRTALAEGGRGATVLDGGLVLLNRSGEPDRLAAVQDVPMTLAGLSRHNVANALAAVAAAIAIGLPRGAVAEGLRTFRADPAGNPGRLNVYDLDGITVVLDVAHNEASLEALLAVGAGLRAPGSILRTVLGTAGDRSDDVLRTLGEMAARGSGRTVMADKARYLRGRNPAQMAALMIAGCAAVGVTDVPRFDSELAAAQALVAEAAAGDVVVVMTHEQRAELDGWLREAGATVDGPEEIRRKVAASA